jgi:hypothetical protein
LYPGFYPQPKPPAPGGFSPRKRTVLQIQNVWSGGDRSKATARSQEAQGPPGKKLTLLLGREQSHVPTQASRETGGQGDIQPWAPGLRARGEQRGEGRIRDAPHQPSSTHRATATAQPPATHAEPPRSLGEASVTETSHVLPPLILRQTTPLPAAGGTRVRMIPAAQKSFSISNSVKI